MPDCRESEERTMVSSLQGSMSDGDVTYSFDNTRCPLHFMFQVIGFNFMFPINSVLDLWPM